MVVMLPLTRGFEAIIDAADLALVSGHKWRASGVAPHIYAVSGFQYKERRETILHRLISGARVGEYVDHINGNTLDNRRANLRVCSHKENMRNRKPQGGRKYKGVFKNTGSTTYSARLNGKYLGSFRSEDDAARAYDAAASAEFGDFARFNLRSGIAK